MPVYTPLIVDTTDSKDRYASPYCNLLCTVEQAELFSLTDLPSHDQFLEILQRLITRSPKKLILHLKRIYFCYRLNLSDQLFAALYDFFFILQNKGTAIKRRMYSGCKSHLSSEHNQQLKLYFTKNKTPPFNRFCILVEGMIGTNNLVKKSQINNESVQDVLTIAYDYIEYSQLELAKQVLTDSLLEQPENKEIHATLLELYRSTRDKSAFNTMYAKLQLQNHPMQQAWDDTRLFFNKLDDEG